ncbi:hypothetical protein MMC26_006446 [Xylographa opegraphella]|nr:hypothetical protein [Xylographa opegraphella]
MSGSNPFRRKQQNPHGQDTFGPGEDEIAKTGVRFPALDTEGVQINIKPITKHVRIVSPHSSKLGSESDDGSQREFPSSPTSWESRNESPRSGRRSTAPFEDTPLEDPFQAASDTEDMNEEDEELPSPVRKTVRSVPNKARVTLGVDSDNPWRTSTLIGNLPNRNTAGDRTLHEHVRTVPAKAQKTLGISRRDSHDEDNFRQQTASPPTTQSVPPKAQRTLGIPSNPFQKNMPRRDSNSFDEDGEGRPGPSRNSSTLSMRAPLGVDVFTRLLMTGDADSSASTPSILPLQGILGDSSSNTDTSSLSRQSILESQTGSHFETPRTSHESSPEAEELQISLQRSTGKFSSMPDTPNSPRQYNISASKTQSSPYARNPAILKSPVELPAEMPATSTQQPASISPKTSKSTDLNKPLPAPPASIISETGASLLGLSLKDKKTHAPSTRESASRARVAPTPPLARRHSQLRSKQPGAPTGRSAPILEENLSPLPTSQATPPTKPPAPPPPRRRNTDRNSLTLDPPNLPELPSTPLKPSPTTEKPRPPVPPARTPSISKRPLAADRPSPSSSSAAMAPPPPPPRRRGSSASGYSLRRPSSEIAPVAEGARPKGADAVPRADEHAPAAVAAAVPVAGSKDGTALQSSADVISKAAAGGSADVLADLSRLQQEVDALRGRYEDKSEAKAEGGMGWGD